MAGRDAGAQAPGKTGWTDGELKILRLVQGDLPHGPAPFAQIARQAGTDEETVITFLRRLKDEGVIRRFGASVRHQRLGYTHNVMVAWKVAEKDCDGAGAIAARLACVSHCYRRPARPPEWPYTLYTMIHGASAEDCEAAIAALRAASPLFGEYAALASEAELKKISPVYFREEDDGRQP